MINFEIIYVNNDEDDLNVVMTLATIMTLTTDDDDEDINKDDFDDDDINRNDNCDLRSIKEWA